MTLIESMIHYMSVECSNRVTNSREEMLRLPGNPKNKRSRKEGELPLPKIACCWDCAVGKHAGIFVAGSSL